MKKAYLIQAFIPSTIYDDRLKFLFSKAHDFRAEGDKMIGIYAWTDKKEIVNEFIDGRTQDIYKVMKVDFCDKEEYEEFQRDYKELKLNYYKYKLSPPFSRDSNASELEIVSTFNEYIQTTEYGQENMYEFGLADIPDINYRIFKPDIIDALDVINYTSEYDKNSGNEEDADNLDFQLSYGCSSLGHSLKFDVSNEVNVLLHLYKFMFHNYEGVNK